MPAKKKKTRRVGATSDEDVLAAAIAAGVDPITLVTGTQTELPTDTKSQKKKKLTKAEKTLAKQQKQRDDFMKSGVPYMNFVDRMDTWLKNKYKKMLSIFHSLDVDGEGYVTFDEFKAVLNDQMAPCTSLELYTLCHLLDQEGTEEINFKELNEGLNHVKQRETTYAEEDIRPSLVLTKRQFNHCSSCKMAIWDGEPYRPDIPRFVEIIFRLVTFDSFKAHPSHFVEIVHSHITGLGLIQIIRDKTDILSPHLSMFTDKSREPEALIPPELTLEEMGYTGGPRHQPQELLIYYDYKVEFTDCPILLCDHYFGQNVKM